MIGDNRKERMARVSHCVATCEMQGAVCTAAIPGRSCLLWVKSRHRNKFGRCPLYPQKRTFRAAKEISLFDHLVGPADKRQWNSDAECSCGIEVDHQFDSYGLLYR